MPGRFSQLGLRLGLDRDSTQGRRRRDCFRTSRMRGRFNHRLGQFVKRGQGGRPGARELNNLCCNGGCRPGLGRGSRRLDRNFLSVRNCCGVGSGMSLGRVQRPRDWNRLTETRPGPKPGSRQAPAGKPKTPVAHELPRPYSKRKRSEGAPAAGAVFAPGLISIQPGSDFLPPGGGIPPELADCLRGGSTFSR